MARDLRCERLELGIEPVRALAALARDDPFLLESVEGGEWSFAGAFPAERLELRAAGDPIGAVGELVGKWRVPAEAARDLPVPFAGGAVGWLGYDLGRTIERLPARALEDQAFPALAFAIYPHVLAFDLGGGRTFLAGLADGFDRAREAYLRRLSEPEPEPEHERLPDVRVPLASNFTRDAYLAAVRRVVDYIHAGDIFQANLSQRFEGPWELGALALYRRLREAASAPFAAYLRDSRGRAVLSASPERFLELRGRRVETWPIKGTRRRGAGAAEDAALAAELVASGKDRAELAMIVDLERNDLGRVARAGSVRVAAAGELRSFRTVHHLVGRVEADLRADVSLADLIRATFPGGSITGAPKIRAMEVIDELEPTRRSVYTGALGWVSFGGDLDLAIAIRTILLDGARATFQAGGAVTAASDPAAEYEETLVKARALARALGGRL